MNRVPESEAHRHAPGSGCLTPVPELWFGAYVEGQPLMLAREGWYRCEPMTLSGSVDGSHAYYSDPNGYLVHDHDGELAAHEPRHPCRWTT